MNCLFKEKRNISVGLTKLTLYLYCLCNHDCYYGKCNYCYHNLFTFNCYYYPYFVFILLTLQRYDFFGVCANNSIKIAY